MKCLHLFEIKTAVFISSGTKLRSELLGFKWKSVVRRKTQHLIIFTVDLLINILEYSQVGSRFLNLQLVCKNKLHFCDHADMDIDISVNVRSNKQNKYLLVYVYHHHHDHDCTKLLQCLSTEPLLYILLKYDMQHFCI